MVYDYKCKSCSHQFTIEDASIGQAASCPLCTSETDRAFLVPPAIKMKKATPTAKGITKDLTEISHLEEARDASRDRHAKYELNREIERINNTPVTGGRNA
jgi:putative FmdB family regulatory protein